jgi:hypothetical protein
METRLGLSAPSDIHSLLAFGGAHFAATHIEELRAEKVGAALKYFLSLALFFVIIPRRVSGPMKRERD